MGLFSKSCNVYSCDFNKEGKCVKSWLELCPKTTTPNNKKVEDYHKQRNDKYKK
jgi:hypothetical protein